MNDWGKGLCARLGKKMVELTGDYTPDLRALLSADIIICTPEKWDGISRNWQNRTYVQKVCLLVIDEIHLLGADRSESHLFTHAMFALITFAFIRFALSCLPLSCLCLSCLPLSCLLDVVDSLLSEQKSSLLLLSTLPLSCLLDVVDSLLHQKTSSP